MLGDNISLFVVAAADVLGRSPRHWGGQCDPEQVGRVNVSNDFVTIIEKYITKTDLFARPLGYPLINRRPCIAIGLGVGVVALGSRVKTQVAVLQPRLRFRCYYNF